jgi:hypothetical protein
MSAWLDITKGHPPVVHFHPDACRVINADTIAHQSLNARTAANGVTNRQWGLCTDCNRNPKL